jgi:hypothetical protein
MYLVHLQDKLLHFHRQNFRPWFCITAPKQWAKTYLPERHNFLIGLVPNIPTVKADVAESSALQALMVAMFPALLETVDDEPVVAEENAVMDHQEESLMAADDALMAVGDSLMAVDNDTLMVADDTLMAAVDTASVVVVVVVAIPMISLAQCQYFVAFLYFGTGFDTDHIYKCYNIQDYSINHIKFCSSVHTCTQEVVSRNMSKEMEITSPHTVNRTLRLVTVLWPGVMYYPSYNLDFMPSDFHLFGVLKKHLCGKLFACAFVCMPMLMHESAFTCTYVNV